MLNRSPFDIIRDRKKTHSLKWDGIGERYGMDGDDLLPMWVADMDFQVSPAIIAAMEEKVTEGIFGYVADYGDFQRLVAQWIGKRHGWSVSSDWIVFCDGVVKALHHIINAFTQPGDKVIVQPPVFAPFYHVVEAHGRRVVENPLKVTEGRYEMDFEDLEEKMAEGASLFILCSPHNPVGRVWTMKELSHLAALCDQYDVLLIADEVHCDIVHQGHRHLSMGQVMQQVSDRFIVCMSPSKTFNMAGLEMSNILIPNGDIRYLFMKERDKKGLVRPNSMGLAAAKGAYSAGDEWVDAVTSYIEDNYKFLKTYMDTHIPEVKVSPLEGTFLVWLKIVGLELDEEKARRLLFDHAKLVLNYGHVYGEKSHQYFRMNIACPRPLLEEGLKRLKQGIATYLKEEELC